MQNENEKIDVASLPWVLLLEDSPESEEEDRIRDEEKSALATLRADYQFIVMCQEMPADELQKMLSEQAEQLASFQQNDDDDDRRHYLKRYHQALIVLEAMTRVESFSGMQTIRELSLERSLDRSTVLKAAQRGVFKGRTRQSGSTWFIDTSHTSYQSWEQKHKTRRVSPGGEAQ